MDRPDLSRLRGVGSADVYKGGRLAATLARVADGIRFEYVPAYLEAALPAVATTLPLDATPRTTVGGAVPAFFAGLLPEGRRLSSLRRAMKTSADDELSLLLGIGTDTIGDVQVVPSGIEPARLPPLIEVRGDLADITFAKVLADAGIEDPIGLPGVQDKASARMISVPLRRAGERFILKVDPPEYPHVVRNEAFFLALGKQLGMPTAPGTLVHDATGRPGLLVRRFDRVPDAEGGTHTLAVEDGCQLMDRWPADKYNVTTEAVVGRVAELCAAQLVAVRALYQQVCFAWLTGNGDLHAKNFSVLATASGEWRVAPAYDLPATVPYGDSTMALSVEGRTRGLSRRILLRFAASAGLPDKVAAQVLDDVLEITLDLPERLQAAVPFEPATMRDYAREVRLRRRQAMAGA